MAVSKAGSTRAMGTMFPGMGQGLGLHVKSRATRAEPSDEKSKLRIAAAGDGILAVNCLSTGSKSIVVPSTVLGPILATAETVNGSVPALMSNRALVLATRKPGE